MQRYMCLFWCRHAVARWTKLNNVGYDEAVAYIIARVGPATATAFSNCLLESLGCSSFQVVETLLRLSHLAAHPTSHFTTCVCVCVCANSSYCYLQLWSRTLLSCLPAMQNRVTDTQERRPVRRLCKVISNY